MFHNHEESSLKSKGVEMVPDTGQKKVPDTIF